MEATVLIALTLHRQLVRLTHARLSFWRICPLTADQFYTSHFLHIVRCACGVLVTLAGLVSQTLSLTLVKLCICKFRKQWSHHSQSFHQKKPNKVRTHLISFRQHRRAELQPVLRNMCYYHMVFQKVYNSTYKKHSSSIKHNTESEKPI